MKVVRAAIEFGVEVVEDTDTGELSLQCICGGIGMYTQRVVLTPEETQEFREGAFDARSLAYEVCHGVPRAVGRVVPSFSPSELVYPPAVAVPKAR